MKKESQIIAPNVLVFISIFILTAPVVIFGIKDNEVYQVGTFSNQIINQNIYNPFIFFIDFLGPGINFPLGNYPFYHPISIIFGSNLNLFFLFSGVVNFYIQIYYFNKILKYFDLNKKDKYFSFLILFSISNFNNFWSDDWISVFYTYTFYFPIIYYLLKLYENRSLNNFIKFSLICSFSFINSHPGIFYNIVLFCFIFLLFNGLKSFFKNKYFYLSIILLLLISSHNLYYLSSEMNKFQEIPRAVQDSYSLKYYLASLGLPLNFSWISITRYPYNGLFFFVGLFSAYKIYKENNSKKYYYINFIFIFFTCWSLADFVKYIPIVSGIWQARDVVNISSYILFFIFLKDFKENKIKIGIVYTNIIMIFIFYIACFYKFIPYNTNQTNILKNNKISEYLKESFSSIEQNKRFENKLYFGADFVNEIYKRTFRNEGIFSTTDFTKLNFSPFHADFKNISLDQIQKSPFKMRGWLKPDLTEINSEIFLSIFRIKYLILTEKDYLTLKEKNNFIILFEKIIRNKKIYFLERRNFNNFVTISKEIYDKITCERLNFINCIQKYENNFNFTNKISLEKIDNNSYKFKGSLNEREILISNFLYDNFWNLYNGTIYHLDKRLVLLDFNEYAILQHDNKIRFILLCISLITIIVTFFYLILYTNKKNIIKY